MGKMKYYKALLFALVLALPFFQPVLTSAATTDVTGGTNGPLCNSGGYFTPSAVTVNSGDKITFSVPSNDPYSGGIQINGFPQGSFVVSRGGSVTTAALTSNVSYRGTWPNSPGCIKGSGTVTVKSASSSSPKPSASPKPSSSPAAKTSSGTSSNEYKTPAATATAKSSTSKATAAPETVVADTITVDGKKITAIQDLTVSQSQPMVLTGTTVPNGTVTLTIHSNPTTATIMANAKGDWTYTVSGLQPGDHAIYAAVTDPKTNKTSASAKLLAFTVASATAAGSSQAVSTPEAKKSSMVMPTAAGLAVLLVIAGAATFLIKKNGVKKMQPAAVSSQTLPNANAAQSPQTGEIPQGSSAQAEIKPEDRKDGNV